MTVLYIPIDWDLDPMRHYTFAIRRIDGTEVFRFTKKVTKVGKDAQRIVISSTYGIEPGEMVVFCAEEMGDAVDDPMETL